jgi:hypothetical protein
MTIKEQLWQEIESSNDELLSKTLDFLQNLKTQETKNTKQKKLVTSTGKSLLKHLQTLNHWSGDDLEECFQTVRSTRAQARFESFNPFDEK